MDKKKLAQIVLNKNMESLVVYVSALEAIEEPVIYLFQVAQVAILQYNKTSTKILVKYAKYANFFFCNLVIKFPKNTSINKYAIKLVKSKHLFYEFIYIFSLVELEVLKTYIKIY